MKKLKCLLLCFSLVTPVIKGQIEYRTFENPAGEVGLHDQFLRGMVTGDVDLDGYTDLVTDAHKVYWGNEDGLFDAESLSFGVSDGFFTPVIADFDGDNRPDIAFGSSEEGSGVTIHLNNDGRRQFKSRIEFDQSRESFWLAAVDVNRDGAIDLVSADRYGGDLVWYELENSRPGTLALKEIHLISSSFFQPLAVLGENLDSDEDVELIVSTGNGIFLLDWERSDGFPDGAFGEPQLLMGQSATGRHLVAEDLDLDGDLDLALTIRQLGVESGSLVVWLRNEGALDFSANVLARHSANYFRWIAAPDVDGDGDPDLVASRMGPFSDGEEGTRFLFFLNDGSGTFSPHSVQADATGQMFSFAIVPQPDGRAGILPGIDLMDSEGWPILLVPEEGLVQVAQPRERSDITFSYVGNNVRIQWFTEPQSSYQVEFSNDLRFWSPSYLSRGATVIEPVIQGTGSRLARIIRSIDNPRIFLRVVRIEVSGLVFPLAP